jgi:hypothetical protein
MLEQNPALQTFLLDPLGIQGWLRPNHLHPPFDNRKAREALVHMIEQVTYLWTTEVFPALGLHLEQSLHDDRRRRRAHEARSRQDQAVRSEPLCLKVDSEVLPVYKYTLASRILGNHSHQFLDSVIASNLSLGHCVYALGDGQEGCRASRTTSAEARADAPVSNESATRLDPVWLLLELSRLCIERGTEGSCQLLRLAHPPIVQEHVAR